MDIGTTITNVNISTICWNTDHTWGVGSNIFLKQCLQHLLGVYWGFNLIIC